MLVITRKLGESILINTGTETIEILLKEFKGKSVRIGIQADKNFLIIRKEIKNKTTTNSKEK